MLGMLGSGTNKIANARIRMNVLLSANVVIAFRGMNVVIVKGALSLCIKAYRVSITSIVNVNYRSTVTLKYLCAVGALGVKGKVSFVVNA